MAEGDKLRAFRDREPLIISELPPYADNAQKQALGGILFALCVGEAFVTAARMEEIRHKQISRHNNIAGNAAYIALHQLHARTGSPAIRYAHEYAVPFRRSPRRHSRGCWHTSGLRHIDRTHDQISLRAI